MSKIKAAIRKNEVDKSGKVNIKIRVHHNGKTRYIGTRFYVKPSQFSVQKGRVLKSHQMSAFINAELKKLEANYESKLVASDDTEKISVKEVVSRLRKKYKVVNLIDLFDEVIKSFQSAGSSTSWTYTTTKSALIKYWGSSFLPVTEVDEAFLKGFMNSRIAEGKSINGTVLSLANIRSVFNKAIDNGVILADMYPFRKFKFSGVKTSKRTLSVSQLKTMLQAKLDPKEKVAVDMFFLSFYLIGMNSKDLFNLKKGNIMSGRMVYVRAKTKKEYSIKIEPEVMEILERYGSTDSDWLLASMHEKYSTVQDFTYAMNFNLKKVAEKCEINMPVTTYYARHSWATIAYNNGISKDNVRLALGHGEETVTDTYIDFDLKLVDIANRKIIDLIV
ncbi:MAG TPA: hypothetical protein DEO33_02540 [Rikenellaceae bacterium]|nr:hypothetical protein [Rikenellaceae bacterium]